MFFQKDKVLQLVEAEMARIETYRQGPLADWTNEELTHLQSLINGYGYKPLTLADLMTMMDEQGQEVELIMN